MHLIFFHLWVASLLLHAKTELPSSKKDKTGLPPKKSTLLRSQDKGIAQEFKDFSEEVASRVDKVVKKKAFDLWEDPWTIQGIPLIFPTSQTGFNVGFKVQLQNIRRQDPHKYELDAQVLSSDLGRQIHFARLDIPHFLNDEFRLTTKVSYIRDISFRYFGVGNDTTVDRSHMDVQDPLYKNTRTGPSFGFQLLRNLTKKFRLGPIFDFKWVTISYPSGGLLDRESPPGIAGGNVHSAGLVFAYNDTDFEPYPSIGDVHEIYLNWSAPWLGSDYNFVRATYTFKRYIPLSKRIVFAHRTLFEHLNGEVPYFELGAVGGSNPTTGIGGDRYFRGYDNNRFMDKFRLVLGFELRWDAFIFHFAKQDIAVVFVPFADMGRVWANLWPLDFSNLHASAGWGARLVWNSRFIVRADFALTGEGKAFYIELGNSF